MEYSQLDALESIVSNFFMTSTVLEKKESGWRIVLGSEYILGFFLCILGFFSAVLGFFFVLGFF